MQVNVAPFDVRQGNFVGAGVNTVTRSGTNAFRGSVYYAVPRREPRRHEGAGASPSTRARSTSQQSAAWVSAARSSRTSCSSSAATRTTKLHAAGHDVPRQPRRRRPVGGNVTRVLASDLDALSAFLQTNFKYETGPYQGYDFETPAKRYLAKLDYNLNDAQQDQPPLHPARLEHRRAGLELVVARLRQPPHAAPTALNFAELELRRSSRTSSRASASGTRSLGSNMANN